MMNQFLPASTRNRTYYVAISLFVGLMAALFIGQIMTSAVKADVDGMPVEVYSTSLTAADEVPPNDSTASGYAVLALDNNGQTLFYRVLVDNIDNISAAHIHVGAVGSNGGVVFTLFDGTGDFDPDNPISGSLSLNNSQVTALQNGDYYINVHTSDVPSGEIRGQIGEDSSVGDYNALLLGDNEVPTVDTDAAGVAQLSIAGPSPSEFSYTISVADIMSITSAHLHTGAVGENGPVALTLYDGTGTFDPDNPLSDIGFLDAETLVHMLTGNIYVNVHTDAVPSGEIRGQVGTTSVYQADLSGANEVPPVTTDASGSGVLALSADTQTLNYRIMVDDIMDITAAHIHEGPAGVNGGVVFTLFDGTGTFDSDNPLAGSATLTVGQVIDLITGNFYINIHTTDNPGGELRAQIEAYSPPADIEVDLAGEQEVPPVSTTADGTGTLHYDSLINKLFYNVQVSDIGSVTGAHIHQGPSGENGPVVFSLIDSGETLANNDPVGGSESLTSEGIVDLLTGFYYINVHSTDYPNGEIRGQILSSNLFNQTLYLPAIFR